MCFVFMLILIKQKENSVSHFLMFLNGSSFLFLLMAVGKKLTGALQPPSRLEYGPAVQFSIIYPKIPDLLKKLKMLQKICISR